MRTKRAAGRWSLLALMSLVLGGGAQAALEPGSEAPDFTLEAALAGEAYSFALAEALKKGPVVLYFYPKAFTPGCTVEARLFAEASDEFAALNATVVGVSNDDIDTLKKFSVEECRNRFAVAADPDGAVIDAYDVKLMPLMNMAQRVSYVITPDRRVHYVWSARKPEEHVKNTLEAVRQWAAR